MIKITLGSGVAILSDPCEYNVAWIIREDRDLVCKCYSGIERALMLLDLRHKHIAACISLLPHHVSIGDFVYYSEKSGLWYKRQGCEI